MVDLMPQNLGTAAAKAAGPKIVSLAFAICIEYYVYYRLPMRILRVNVTGAIDAKSPEMRFPPGRSVTAIVCIRILAQIRRKPEIYSEPFAESARPALN